MLDLQTKLFTIILCGSLLGFSTGLWSPLLNVYLASIGIPIMWIGVIVTVQAAISGVVMLPSGTLSDIIGRRKPIIISLLLTSLILLSLTLIRDPFLLLIIFSVQGLALGLRSPIFPAYIADIARSRVIGATYAAFSFFNILAMTVGTVVGAYTADIYGFTLCFIIASSICFLSVFLAFFFLKESTVTRFENFKSSLKRSFKGSVPALTLVLKRRRLLLMLIGVTIHQFFIQMMFPYLALYMRSYLGYSLATVGLILSIRRIGFLLGQLPSGKLIDRYGPELSLFIHIFLTAPMILLFLISGNVMAVATAMIIWGLAGGLDMPSRRVIIVTSSDPSVRGGTLGAVQSISEVSSLVAPVAGAWLWNLFDPQAPFQAAILGNIAASIPILILLFAGKSKQSLHLG